MQFDPHPPVINVQTMSFPTIFELHDIFFDETKCSQYLQAHGAFYSTRECEACSDRMSYVASKQCFRCPKSHCRKEISLRKNSFFDELRLPMSHIMLLGYLWLNKSAIAATQSISGKSNNTIRNMNDYFRQAVASTLEEMDTTIGGIGVIVELDETKLGKRKYNRGHRVDGVWILGGVERTPERRAFMVPVQDRSAETLQSIICQHVRPGSVVHTDLWRGYFGLDSHNGYVHRTVNHSLHFVDPMTSVHTNTIEGTWHGLKICIAPRNRGWDGIEDRLFEFIWRRKHSMALWGASMKAICDIHYEIE